MSKSQKQTKKRSAYFETFGLKDLFEELADFAGNEQSLLLLHMRHAFAAYAKESPNFTQDAFATYGRLVELINAINSNASYIEKKAAEYSRLAESL